MERTRLISELWNAMDRRQWEELAAYFCDDAVVFWPSTNERFTVPEFIEVNRAYPGTWTIQIERLQQVDDLVVSVVKVALAEGRTSFHAVSFFEFRGDKIGTLYEYWGEDGDPPQWRINRSIGTRIS
ncbi:MAG TPA: nuclear transport factor 2 family protein [Clostridia bacterium]|nr:nuclear transport factor 2 family protein [Clostridia bacterium]